MPPFPFSPVCQVCVKFVSDFQKIDFCAFGKALFFHAFRALNGLKMGVNIKKY